MSYLLDALKKNEQASTSITQPHYNMHGSQNDASLRFYKRVAHVLGLVVALIIGYTIGVLYSDYKYSGSVPSQAASQQVAGQATGQVVEQQPTQTKTAAAGSENVNTSASVASTPETNPAIHSPNIAVTNTNEHNVQPVQARNTAVTTNPSGQIANSANTTNLTSSTSEPDTSSIDPELLKEFNQAVAATKNRPIRNPSPDPLKFSDIPHLADLPVSVQQSVPNMNFDAHIYSSDPAQSWIKVNGKTLQEKQWISTEIQLLKILPQQVVMEMGEHRFSLAALSNW